MDKDQNQKKAIELISKGGNWILIAESSNISVSDETDTKAVLAMLICMSLNGLDIHQVLSFITAVRDAEESLLEHIRKKIGFVGIEKNQIGG